MKTIFNDPDLHKQWYFLKSDPLSNHLSHNLDSVWSLGIKGEGVNVAILDRDLEMDHRDLESNYKESLSFNFVNNSRKVYSVSNSHVTSVVGLISAVANNGICGVGAAPSSKYIILQIFGDFQMRLIDYRMARALLHENQLIHIYLINWKMYDFRDINKYPGKNSGFSLKIGYKAGRKGLGSIFVASSGNQEDSGTSCAYNGYLQVPEVLVFGAITSMGLSNSATVRCSAVLAASLSSDENNWNNGLYSTASGNLCKNSTSGSYSSTAISAGILALLISANPLLSVRNIRNLITLTSIQYDSYAVRNRMGFLYSYSMGFGMLNAYLLIEASNILLKNSMADENICSTSTIKGDLLIPRDTYKIFYIYSSGCMDSTFCVTEIEQTLAIFTLTVRNRLYATIYLTSPSGTTFLILEPRYSDSSLNGFVKWQLKIMGYLGERAAGFWKIRIVCEKISCRLKEFKLTFYGTCINKAINFKIHNRVNKRIRLYDKNFSQDHLSENDYPDQNTDRFSFTEKEFPNIKLLAKKI